MEDEAVKGFSRKQLCIALLSLIALNGCSWIQSRQSLFGDEEETAAAEQAPTSVPKDQYDQLLQKYEALQTRVQTLEATTPDMAAPATLENDPAASQEILGALQNANSGELAETVDVFSGNTAAQTMVASDNYENVDVESQIRNLQTADGLVAQNKFDEALNLLKSLEKSPVRQVRVRARYLVGESLFKQGDFDLSMQVFEEIIQKEAFSGMVLKALGRLIGCSEKLKLDKKKEQYYSLLHDFFES